MTSLRKLSLSEVDVNVKFFEGLISGAPSLEELVLSCVHNIPELRFTAPNVKKLAVCYCIGLIDCPNLKILNILTCDAWNDRLIISNASSLHEVDIGTCCTVDEFVKYVKKFSNVPVFKYSHDDYEGSEFSNFKEVDFPQTKWKSLHITSRLYADDLECMFKAVSSSPYLEELIFIDPCYYADTTLNSNVLLLECAPLCKLQQLKSVTICGYKVPCQGILQLAQFFLKCCATLEKMIILPGKKSVVNYLEDLMFVKQLLSFSRASSNARVIFGPETY